jgi:hypothetical protein
MPRGTSTNVRWIAATLTASAVLVSATTFAGRADAASRPRCANVKGRRLVSNRAIKVVEHGDESKGFVDVCVPPNGRVRLAGSAYDATIQRLYSIKVIAVAGTWVALDLTSVVDFHGSEEMDEVFDAKSGSSYGFFDAAIPEGQGFEGIAPTAVLGSVVLNRFGQLASALIEEGKCRIVGIEPTGKRRVLDSAPEAQIPPSSLKLQGHTVQWVDAGSTRSATL